MGHHEVDKNEVWICFLNAGDGGLSVGSANDIVSSTLKNEVYDIERCYVVIYH
jgi:hypothetical protein